jgi:hypothetical protein
MNFILLGDFSLFYILMDDFFIILKTDTSTKGL